jgi:hypothetical protein
MSNPKNHQHTNPSEFNTDHPPVPLGSSSHGIRESGQALIVLLVLIITVVIVLVFDFARPTALAVEQDKQTAAALAQAKDALIGWSVQRTPSGALPNARPGELPCPDSNNDGFEDGTCVAGALGRVPWKTLGIPEPKDGAGETLWYTLAGPFRIWAVNANQIDNDTKGDITVYSGSSSTVMTSEAVAVIFSPGAVLGTQNRDPSTTALCPTTGTTIARNLCAANYLDTTGGANNATTNGPYISAQPSNAFDDRLLVITTDSLITTVEKRAAREMLTLLQRYKALSGCNCYPWAAGMDDPFDDDSVDGRTRGGVPIENALPDNWDDLGITVPSWMIGSNIWGKKFYYAVAHIDTETHTAGTLTVDGVAGKRLVLITTGPAGASRPSTNVSDYLDDAENSNNDNTFQTPSSTAYARDRIYTIP